MKILLCFNGLIRNFLDTFVLIEKNIIQCNLDCSFDIIVNTSSYDNQISEKKIFNKYNYESNIIIENQISKILTNYHLKQIIFYDVIDITCYVGIFFDRIINTCKNFKIENYDYIFFLRFDVLVKNKINFNNFNKQSLYFFDGGNSGWFMHDKDIDYALLGNPKLIQEFISYNLELNYKFYSNEILKILNENNIKNILNIYEILPFNSRWKKYTSLEKEKIINSLNGKIKNLDKYKKIDGEKELLIFAFYCKNLYIKNFTIEIFNDFVLGLKR